MKRNGCLFLLIWIGVLAVGSLAMQWFGAELLAHDPVATGFAWFAIGLAGWIAARVFSMR